MRLNREFDTAYFRAHPQLEHYLQFLIPEEKEIKTLTLPQAIEHLYLTAEVAKQLPDGGENALNLIREFHKASDFAAALSKVANTIYGAHAGLFPGLNPKVRNRNDELVRGYNARAQDFFSQISPDKTTDFSYS